jgi:hypothetical protein
MWLVRVREGMRLVQRLIIAAMAGSPTAYLSADFLVSVDFLERENSPFLENRLIITAMESHPSHV